MTMQHEISKIDMEAYELQVQAETLRQAEAILASRGLVVAVRKMKVRKPFASPAASSENASQFDRCQTTGSDGPWVSDQNSAESQIALDFEALLNGF